MLALSAQIGLMDGSPPYDAAHLLGPYVRHGDSSTYVGSRTDLVLGKGAKLCIPYTAVQ